MVGVVVTSDQLRDRAVRVVSDLAEFPPAGARALPARRAGSVRDALTAADERGGARPGR